MSVDPLSARCALGDGSPRQIDPVLGQHGDEGQEDQSVGAALRAKDQAAHGVSRMNLSSVREETVSDVDEFGFYAPGSWTREQLVAFANELDSLAPEGRETAVDLGIIRAVKTLRDKGVETFESCEGGDGHSMAEPTVRFLGGVEAGWKALSVCLTYDLPVRALRRYWRISSNGEPSGPNWEITFRRKLL